MSSAILSIAERITKELQRGKFERALVSDSEEFYSFISLRRGRPESSHLLY